MSRRKLWVIVLTFALVLLVTSCGLAGNKNPIIGKWQGNDQTGSYTWEFLNSGDLMVTVEGYILGGTWRTIDNDHIEITINTPVFWPLNEPVSKAIIETSFSEDKTEVTLTGLGQPVTLYKTTSTNPQHMPTPTYQGETPAPTSMPTPIYQGIYQGETPAPTSMPTPIYQGIQQAETALDVDLHSVKTAVDAYVLQAGEWPTVDGSLPPQGQYAPIAFNASFDKAGRVMSFYPQFISYLPRHWDEGVWRIDSAALVSVDMAPDKY